MAYDKIGILGAMPLEVAQLYEQMVSSRCEHIGGVDFYIGVLYGKNVVACCAGMGKVNAAAATQLLATHFGVKAVLFSGIAGNMSNAIGVGDVVISGSVVYHDAENRMIAEAYPHLQAFTADEELCRAAVDTCMENSIRHIVGTVATGDLFVGDSDTKNAIAEKCHPACVEMEGAAVAHIAAKNDLPFVIIRTMSDNADTDVDTQKQKEFDLNDYYSAAPKICAGILQKI